MSLVNEKIAILVTMFVVTVCFGVIPRKLVQGQTSVTMNNLVSLLTCFSGGVFLAACLLDLFPDVRESIDKVLDEIEVAYHTKIDYPVAEFIIVMGFFIVLITEQIVLDCKERNGNPPDGEREPLLGHHHDQDRLPNNDTTIANDGHDAHSGHAGHEHHHDHVFEHSSLRSVLLFIALTFHSLFEGLAIGLQVITGQLISIFTAVIVHKAIMAFSLGLTLAQSTLSRKAFITFIVIFSVASPVGMAVGIALTDMSKSLGRDIANGVLQGLSGGTFLYITFFEVLPLELKIPGFRMLKVAAVIVGFASICGLLFITH